MDPLVALRESSYSNRSAAIGSIRATGGFGVIVRAGIAAREQWNPQGREVPRADVGKENMGPPAGLQRVAFHRDIDANHHLGWARTWQFDSGDFEGAGAVATQLQDPVPQIPGSQARDFTGQARAVRYGMLRIVWAAALCLLLDAPVYAGGKPIPVKVVVVAMFERGADTGDEPGELQYWVERNHLDRVIPFPQGYHDLRMNNDGVLAVLTGVGTAKSAAAIMALGLDPRFDLTKAYWLVAGIAGVNPLRGSLGSAAWAEWVVDGDLAREIDAREIPAGWKTGYLPLRGAVPYEQPHTSAEGEVYRLSPGLVTWAFELTRNVPLDDSDEMRFARNQYDPPAARRPPGVMKGDTLSSGTFWHGELLNQWAIDWVQYHTGGQGDFVTTAMEDTGTLQSLTLLAKAGRADLNRVLVLRTASNYDLPPRGVTAAQNLARLKLGIGYTAYLPALEAAWKVGNTVVADLVRNWSRYREAAPAVR